ncbi:MAG: hypothetical protein AMS27_02345 [Bacteroides sp. SM23_62_1]|nr:MAG: hypothetical protein AMS27_02345 [Bacteroides sp. SM23_62_1]
MRQFKYPDERLIAFTLLGILFIFFLVISFLQEGTYGGADDISHYNISSNVFQYPHLILDLWGKPVYTLLAAPFARFGMEGVIIFNILIGLLTCYFTYLIARIMQYKDAWLLILFICFAPMYTVMIVSGMTEILFGFALIVAAYLFFKEKYIFSSVVVSFLPFIRNEGIVIIPVYLVIFAWYKKWKAIPFLLSGVSLFSLAGAFYYHDLLWIIHQWPYGDTSGIYGSGSIFYYVSNAARILGIPLTLMFITGLLYSLTRLFSEFSFKYSHKLSELFVILGPLFVYIAAHSYAWYRGTVGSGGLIRFMTPVLPLASIYCLQGINLITKPRFINIWLKTGIYAILLYFIFITPFKVYTIPRRFNEPERLIFKASQWLKHHALDKGKIYFFDPLLQHYMGVNYFDRERINQFLPNPENPGEKIPEGSYIVWDAHFGANEGRVSLKSLVDDPSLKLIKLFKPVNYFWVLGKNYYNIFVFRKDTMTEKNYNYDQLNTLSFYNDDDIKQIKTIRYIPFDIDTLTNLPDTIIAGRACTLLDTTSHSGYTVRISGNEIDPEFTGIRASIYYYPVEILREQSCSLQLSVFRDKWNRIIHHTTLPYYLYHLPGMWNLMIVEAVLPEKLDNSGEIIVQISQSINQGIYIYDLLVEQIKY